MAPACLFSTKSRLFPGSGRQRQRGCLALHDLSVAYRDFFTATRRIIDPGTAFILLRSRGRPPDAFSNHFHARLATRNSPKLPRKIETAKTRASRRFANKSDASNKRLEKYLSVRQNRTRIEKLPTGIIDKYLEARLKFLRVAGHNAESLSLWANARPKFFLFFFFFWSPARAGGGEIKRARYLGGFRW